MGQCATISTAYGIEAVPHFWSTQRVAKPRDARNRPKPGRPPETRAGGIDDRANETETIRITVASANVCVRNCCAMFGELRRYSAGHLGRAGGASAYNPRAL